jgi:hypothetical protein
MPSQKLISVINAFIDVYADETREYDQPVFVSGGFLEALTGIVSRIRNEVSALGRSDNVSLLIATGSYD